MKNIHTTLAVACIILLSTIIGCKTPPSEKPVAAETKVIRGVWPKEKAQAWYQQRGWLVGSDFLPSSAINQLEMWQAESFDTTTINRELGYAEGIGMNSMRVYLHHLAWQLDPEGFKN
jgi:hypothetical protein